MTPTTFGRPMREHFRFAPEYVPLNHGSYGTWPACTGKALNEFREMAEARPDTFVRYSFVDYQNKSRDLVAEYIKADRDEIVFIQNATTGTDTVLRCMKWEKGDVIVYYDCLYGALLKGLERLLEYDSNVETVCVDASWPISDDELVRRFEETIKKVNEGKDGRRVRMAIFDTIISMPGIRVPFERLAELCRKHNVLSLVDGAHGLGHIELNMETLQPDFFVSNVHKWFYVPRSAAIFYVPKRNQSIIRSALPTSHGFQPLPRPGQPIIDNPLPTSGRPPFIELFDCVGTQDATCYLCVPEAARFRNEVCGGEKAIWEYLPKLAKEGGIKAAGILGTEVMTHEGSCMHDCAFSNVRLPLEIGEGDGQVKPDSVNAVSNYIKGMSVRNYDTFLQVVLYRGSWWWRISAQIYLELEDIEKGARFLKEICGLIEQGKHLEIEPWMVAIR